MSAESKPNPFGRNAPDWTQFKQGVGLLMVVKDYLEENFWSAYKILLANNKNQWDHHKQKVKSRFIKGILMKYSSSAYATRIWCFGTTPLKGLPSERSNSSWGHWTVHASTVLSLQTLPSPPGEGQFSTAQCAEQRTEPTVEVSHELRIFSPHFLPEQFMQFTAHPERFGAPVPKQQWVTWVGGKKMTFFPQMRQRKKSI